MRLKPTLTAFAVALVTFAQPVLAEFTHSNGEVTHYDGIPVPPIQTVAQARAETEKKIAAIKAREAEETATRSQIGNRPSAIEHIFYTGKPYIEETGQYAFLFRSYDPGLSRWTTSDPSGFPDGANNYLHVNNLYGAIDDTGLQIIKFAYSTYIETPVVDFFGIFSGGQKTWQILTVNTVTRSASYIKGTEMTYEFDYVGGPVINSGQSNGNTITASILSGASHCNFSVRMYGDESNPLTPSPGITYQVDLNFNLTTGLLSWNGSHDKYPSHQFWVDDVSRHTFSHVTAGTNPLYLVPAALNQNFSGSMGITQLCE